MLNVTVDSDLFVVCS